MTYKTAPTIIDGVVFKVDAIFAEPRTTEAGVIAHVEDKFLEFKRKG